MVPQHAALAGIGLKKKQIAQLERQAKEHGVSAERYIRELIERDIEVTRIARTSTFAEIMGPVQPFDEAELDRLVDEARTRYHKQKTRRK